MGIKSHAIPLTCCFIQPNNNILSAQEISSYFYNAVLMASTTNNINNMKLKEDMNKAIRQVIHTRIEYKKGARKWVLVNRRITKLRNSVKLKTKAEKKEAKKRLRKMKKEAKKPWNI